MINNILLLTATIEPKANQPALKVIDPATRLSQYRTALDFYIGLLDSGVISGIVFFDNSGVPLDVIRVGPERPDVEIFSEYGLDYPEGYHRGYGELSLIYRAYSASRIIRYKSPSIRVWKVTGRYIVSNLKQIIKSAPHDADFYCSASKNWAEMSIMAWSPLGYGEVIKGLREKLANGMAPELILADALNIPSSHPTIRIVKDFRWPPRIIGIRGTDGSSFGGRLPIIRHAIDIARCYIQRFK